MKPHAIFRPVRIGFLAIVALAVCAGEGTAAGGPPNFLFILVDDLGWIDLGCYGADLHETPNIDRLASQGTRFINAYAAAPVCSPTRASIMSGKAPARLHMTIWHEGAVSSPNRRRPWLEAKAEPNLPLENVTFAEVLKEGGYQTWHVGKWHLGTAAYYPQAHGFDLNIGGTFWGAPETFWYPYRGRKRFREWRYVPDLPFGKEGEYLTDRLTDEALVLLERAGDKPFFLNMWYHTVHTPIEGKPHLVEYYEKKLKAGMHHQNAAYAAMVRSLDENVGRLLAKLDELELAQNTVVILFSDNGGYVNDFNGSRVTNNHPLRSGKGSLYEGGIREPLIVRWPGKTRPGSVRGEQVISTDLYPTFLEMAGLDGDPAHNRLVDGVSLVPLLADAEAKLAPRVLYWHYPHYYPTTTPVSALRDGDWKLLKYYQEGRLELYNLKDDPSESRNLAASDPAKVNQLHVRLRTWLDSVNAQLPVPKPDWKP